MQKSGLALVRQEHAAEKPKPTDRKERLFRTTLRFGPPDERDVETATLGHMYFLVCKSAQKFLRNIEAQHPGRLKEAALKSLSYRIVVRAPLDHPVKDYVIVLTAKELIVGGLPSEPP